MTRILRQLNQPPTIMVVVGCLFLVFLMLAGCESPNDEDSAVQTETVPRPIDVVFVDADDLAEPLARRWSAQTGGELKVVSLSIDDLFGEKYGAIQDADVIVYPSHLLAHLVADELVSVLPDEVWTSEELDSKGFLDDCRTRMIRFGRERWATPISNASTLMFIRKDVLEKLELEVPRTWAELSTLKAKLDSAGADFQMPKKLALPSKGNDAAYTFLSIAAATIRQRGKLDSLFKRSSMEPLLDSAPFVSALETFKELCDQDELSRADSAGQFFSGEAAVALGWPIKNQVIENEETVGEKVFENTVVARLPGSDRWYDFGEGSWKEVIEATQRVDMTGNHAYQASILKSASYPTSVHRFVAWLSSKSIANQVISDTNLGAPTRFSHLGDIQNWTGDILSVENADRIVELINEIGDENIKMTFPRIRGSHEYLKVLADGVRNYLRGDMPAADALKVVADKWERLTEKYGRQKQIDLLRIDLGF